MMRRYKYLRYKKKQRSEIAKKGWITRHARMREEPAREEPTKSGAHCFELSLTDLRTGDVRKLTLMSSGKRKNTFDTINLEGQTGRGVSATKIAAKIRKLISL